MSEMTKSQIVQMFRNLAKEDPAEAKLYFERTFLQGRTGAERQSQFLLTADQVAAGFDGAEFQTPQPLENTLARIGDPNTRMVIADIADTLFQPASP